MLTRIRKSLRPPTPDRPSSPSSFYSPTDDYPVFDLKDMPSLEFANPSSSGEDGNESSSREDILDNKTLPGVQHVLHYQQPSPQSIYRVNRSAKSTKSAKRSDQRRQDAASEPPLPSGMQKPKREGVLVSTRDRSGSKTQPPSPVTQTGAEQPFVNTKFTLKHQHSFHDLARVSTDPSPTLSVRRHAPPPIQIPAASPKKGRPSISRSSTAPVGPKDIDHSSTQAPWNTTAPLSIGRARIGNTSPLGTSHKILHKASLSASSDEQPQSAKVKKREVSMDVDSKSLKAVRDLVTSQFVSEDSVQQRNSEWSMLSSWKEFCRASGINGTARQDSATLPGDVLQRAQSMGRKRSASVTDGATPETMSLKRKSTASTMSHWSYLPSPSEFPLPPVPMPSLHILSSNRNSVATRRERSPQTPRQATTPRHREEEKERMEGQSLMPSHAIRAKLAGGTPELTYLSSSDDSEPYPCSPLHLPTSAALSGCGISPQFIKEFDYSGPGHYASISMDASGSDQSHGISESVTSVSIDDLPVVFSDSVDLRRQASDRLPQHHSDSQKQGDTEPLVITPRKRRNASAGSHDDRALSSSKASSNIPANAEGDMTPRADRTPTGFGGDGGQAVRSSSKKMMPGGSSAELISASRFTSSFTPRSSRQLPIGNVDSRVATQYENPPRNGLDGRRPSLPELSRIPSNQRQTSHVRSHSRSNELPPNRDDRKEATVPQGPRQIDDSASKPLQIADELQSKTTRTKPTPTRQRQRSGSSPPTMLLAQAERNGLLANTRREGKGWTALDPLHESDETSLIPPRLPNRHRHHGSHGTAELSMQTGAKPSRPSNPISPPPHLSPPPPPPPPKGIENGLLEIPIDEHLKAMAPPSPTFATVPLPWRGLTMEAAKWMLTSKQLQEIAGKAIRHSSQASSIRILPQHVLESELPIEMEHLENRRDMLQQKYKHQARRRQVLLRSLQLYIDGSDPSTAQRLTDELLDSSLASDRICEELYRVTDQLDQLHCLCNNHQSSALAMALRKLNTSLIRQTKENTDLREKVAALESEREEAWNMAEKLEGELHDFFARVDSPGIDSPANPSSQRSSRVLSARKSQFRVSESSLRFSIRPESAISLPHAVTNSGSQIHDSLVPPVPPIPSSTLSVPAKPLMPRVGVTFAPALPRAESTTPLQAHPALCELLGVTPRDVKKPKRRPQSACFGPGPALGYTSEPMAVAVRHPPLKMRTSSGSLKPNLTRRHSLSAIKPADDPLLQRKKSMGSICSGIGANL